MEAASRRVLSSGVRLHPPNHLLTSRASSRSFIPATATLSSTTSSPSSSSSSSPRSRVSTCPNQTRHFTNTPRPLAGENSFGFPSSAQPGPTTYFSHRQSLPMNTVIRFVPQQTAWIVERMGKFNRILEPGLAILVPFLDRIAYVKSLKEAALEIPSQNAITADNVTLELDGVLYTRVFDAYKASYGVEDAEYAISQLAQTTMRSEIGQLTLDHVLKERATLNTNITQAINEAAQDWGVVCLRYEIRDIHAPDGVVAAMHRQVTAERSKRAEILESEGQRQSAINIAEGRKQSVILASEALRSEQINMATGEAEAIMLKAAATAKGIDAVAKSMRDGQENAQGAVSLSVAEKYVEAFSKLAREGTAVVVPGNVGDIGGMIASAMAVYGKVNEGQVKAMAAKTIGAQAQGSQGEGGEGEEGSKKRTRAGELTQSHFGDTAKTVPEQGDVADSVLEGFEQTSRRRKS
ncbi:cell division cycle 20-like protein 1, cofactor-APC complex [Blastomyces silverae]|uniref:Cell division cycle 20-like protein 1, cofactor-APC complex n=1 Tax=Blastomyces silverae TaxID=2060906 RepID=A0A0H1BNA1_9EURO|nr:cell division cycle 20-like protein 1, cofactor-APC complex [Blastomyces silverae]